jgi:hypothetical protein
VATELLFCFYMGRKFGLAFQPGNASRKDGDVEKFSLQCHNTLIKMDYIAWLLH